MMGGVVPGGAKTPKIAGFGGVKTGLSGAIRSSECQVRGVWKGFDN